MTRTFIAVLAALVAAIVFAAPAPAAAPLHSDNVTLLDKRPEATGAIGARFSPNGKTMYVTAASGLFIYDITKPGRPKLQGTLALPHFENEDVDVGDGIVVISNDPSFSTVGALYVIDVTDARHPRLKSVTPTKLPTKALTGAVGINGTNNGHIANCIQGCRYLWTTGTNEGITVYDLADKTTPKFLGTFTMPVPKSRAGQPATAGGFTHDVEVDKTGVAWVTGEDGTFGYRQTTDPLKPQLVYRSDENVTNSGNSGPTSPETANGYPLDFLHHNSKRTGGGRGSVMAITEEDYTRPGCQGQGSLQTWKITGEKNSDGTTKLKLLDLWTTELNELASFSGRSPATVNCSAHWFDEQGGLVAQGWYDQGVRFLDISKPTDIRQVGYWATAGSFWAAYFAPTDRRHEIVYGLDTAGGIDVLRIKRSGRQRTVVAPKETFTKIDPASGRRYVPSKTFGMACVLPGQGLVRN